MKTIGFIIMLIFGISGLLVGFSIKNMADLLLVVMCICLFLLGLMMWRKRTFGALTKTSAIIMAIASVLLFSAVLPDANELDSKPHKETAVKDKLTKEKSKEETIEFETKETVEKIEETELTESEETFADEIPQTLPEMVVLVGNANSHVYHAPDCEGVINIKEKNRVYLSSVEEAEKLGMTPAGDCQPAEFN